MIFKIKPICAGRTRGNNRKRKTRTTRTTRTKTITGTISGTPGTRARLITTIVNRLNGNVSTKKSTTGRRKKRRGEGSSTRRESPASAMSMKKG